MQHATAPLTLRSLLLPTLGLLLVAGAQAQRPPGGRGEAQIQASAANLGGGGVFEQDSLALVALYNATDGPNWERNDDWLTEVPVKDWWGVGLDDNDERVWILTLNENLLNGPIPAEMGQLTGLNTLWLYDNQLSGSIPPELGDMTNLSNLLLRDNQLTGSIPPELGGLGSLTDLLLQNNQLSGPIPPELGFLTNLLGLKLSNNQLSGPMPLSLINLIFLEDFYYLDTDLCAPNDPAFQAWLAGIEDHQGNGQVCDGTPVEPNVPPGRYALDAPFPNPATTSLTVPFELAEPSVVALEIYDVLGRRVLVLVDEERGAGAHRVVLGELRLAPGVYLCVMRSGGRAFTQRFSVTR